MVGETPLTDTHIEQAALAIEQHVQIPIRKLDLVRKALIAQCRTQERDPIRDWLEGLPPWDGQSRLLTWLPKYTGAPPNSYTGETGRLWLVSMVARGLQPGCQCRSVIVLMGDEDIGKSELVKLLASEPWYRDISGSLEGKEAHMLMKGAWLVELGELSSMSKTEENRLKSFITMCNDDYVPKYANDPVKQARRTILVGTLNPEGDKTFLRGQTGNTRYYPVAVGTINLEQLEALREPLFAEALVYYRDHLTDWWRLSPEADAAVRQVREDHRVRSVYEEALGRWLEEREGHATCWEEICTHFLLLEAKERWKDTKLQKDIAQAMVANGWTQDERRRIPVYGRVRPWVPTPQWRTQEEQRKHQAQEKP
jgi:predicted P-loop ATPase